MFASTLIRCTKRHEWQRGLSASHFHRIFFLLAYVPAYIHMYLVYLYIVYMQYIPMHIYIYMYMYKRNYIHNDEYSYICIYTHIYGGPYHPPLWQSHGGHGKHEPWKQRLTRHTRRRTVPLWRCNMAKVSTILSWLGLWFCLFGAVVKTARKGPKTS